MNTYSLYGPDWAVLEAEPDTQRQGWLALPPATTGHLGHVIPEAAWDLQEGPIANWMKMSTIVDDDPVVEVLIGLHEKSVDALNGFD